MFGTGIDKGWIDQLLEDIETVEHELRVVTNTKHNTINYYLKSKHIMYPREIQEVRYMSLEDIRVVIDELLTKRKAGPSFEVLEYLESKGIHWKRN